MRRKFGPVIAERRLISRGKAGARVRVSLGHPRPGKSKGEWECPFRIRGKGVSVLEFGYGIDSMQALTTALEGIRVLLGEKFGLLAWEDGLPDHSGFQRQIPLLGGAFTTRLERLVDRELNRELRRRERRTAKRRGGVGKTRRAPEAK